MDNLISQAIAGDAEAIASLYERYTPQLRRYLTHRVRTDDIDDVLSQVWLQVIKSLPAYEDRGWPFSAWLYRIAQARSIDFVRSQQRHPHLPLLDCHATQGPETEIGHWDAQAVMPRLLAALSTDRQRQVIMRRFLLDQSLLEVAAALDLSVDATKALQHRALTAMRQALAAS